MSEPGTSQQNKDKGIENINSNLNKITISQTLSMAGLDKMFEADLSVIDYQDLVTAPFSLADFIRDNATLINTITIDDVKKILISGKKVNDLFKNAKEQAKILSQTTTGYDKTKGCNFIQILGFKVRIFGDADNKELTKKRFFALIHNINKTKRFNITASLAQGIKFHEGMGPDAYLVGSGIEYNYRAFDSSSNLIAGALALDYQAYIAQVKQAGGIHVDKVRFLMDPEKLPTIKGILRQTTGTDYFDKNSIEVGKKLFIEHIQVGLGNRINKRVVEFLSGDIN